MSDIYLVSRYIVAMDDMVDRYLTLAEARKRAVELRAHYPEARITIAKVIENVR